MKTEEAIEFIGNIIIVANIKEYDFDDSPGLIDRLQNLEIEDNFKKVIDLLQQGEKYKQMWFELYEIASEFNFFPLMDKLKLKYFPIGITNIKRR